MSSGSRGLSSALAAAGSVGLTMALAYYRSKTLKEAATSSVVAAPPVGIDPEQTRKVKETALASFLEETLCEAAVAAADGDARERLIEAAVKRAQSISKKIGLPDFCIDLTLEVLI
ncbi:MAG: hypothetical protein L7U87_03340 [Chlamydiales bacterium]|nr:hypothetical protein [Chlamydiales bacterium]